MSLQVHRLTTWRNDDSITAQSLNNEIQNIINKINTQTAVNLVAPDGKIFALTIIYDTDGVTPLLQISPA